MIEQEIIYSDENIIVINKPPGISVHDGLGIRGETLIDFLLQKFPEIKNVGDSSVRPGIVHRLDKDTSGVMVVARNRESFQVLKKMFQGRKVEKIYVALVCGVLQIKNGVINQSIGRLVKKGIKRGVASTHTEIIGAREAVTFYKVKKAWPSYSLTEFFPKTGRMHQIRVHAQALGHPIACDKIYGGKKVCCPTGLKRMFLHASRITFSLGEGKRFSFEADLPEDLSHALREIENKT